MRTHPKERVLVALAGIVLLVASARASSGDPQVKTDHPWYPGELSCSTFERLFKTEAAVYRRVTGRSVDSDEDKALAAWFWRNCHYAHGEDGKPDQYDQGFTRGDWNREYWTGLFAHGFGLCGTTHSQWTAEMNALLGQCRSRVVGVDGHNSFEVYLTGGAYGAGRWALLDHDISTVIFAPDGSRLLSIQEVMADLKTLRSPGYKPQRQRGWRVAGLYDGDAGAYSVFKSAEYLSGYAGPPPMVHLRKGESLRRYLNPGLDDGKTFVFWGCNYKAAGIPGPERSRSWVNQPQNMYNATRGTGFKAGQVRFANAIYTYAPNFADGSYKEGVVDEAADHVTFEFYTPYVIACTPPNDKSWGIYDAGGKNGLVISGRVNFPVQVSTDQARTWQAAQVDQGAIDLTDMVKGHQQYLLRFGAGAATLQNAGLSWRTVCQCNSAIIPRLHDGTTTITMARSNQAIVCAGPNKDQAEAHVVDGRIGSPTVTLELKSPRGERPTRIYAASWNSSGNPPTPVAYRIDYSTDAGRTWHPIVSDWRIIRRSPEPDDFWSQSFTCGDAAITGGSGTSPVRVRFGNDGKKSYRKVEAYLVYETRDSSPVDVTFAWKEAGAALKTASHAYPKGPGQEDSSWQTAAGKQVETLWVEYAVKGK